MTHVRALIATIAALTLGLALGAVLILDAHAQQLSPKQFNLSNDEDFIGRVTVTLAKYATAGLQTIAGRTCSTTNGSKVLTSVSNVAGMVIGQEVELAGVPDQPAYIVSVDSASQITISEAAQATATGVSILVKPFPSTGPRATTFAYAKLVAANARVYALQWMPYLVGSTNVANTISYDAETGKITSSVTDAALESQIITDFLARSL